MFGNLSSITNGDIVELTNLSTGVTIQYSVYDRYVIDPTDTSCTSQLTGGNKEITLITCKEYGQKRLVVKAREVK
jgi:LPXTG-site transpeptidase (sortase) family protein